MGWGEGCWRQLENVVPLKQRGALVLLLEMLRAGVSSPGLGAVCVALVVSVPEHLSDSLELKGVD